MENPTHLQLKETINSNYSTDLLLKALGDLIQENFSRNAKARVDLDLDQIVEELEILFPEFHRQDVVWDLWPELLKNLFQVIKPAILNRN